MIDANEIDKLVHELAQLDEYQLPSGATNEDCDAFSQRTGITMPPELREWLLLYNGPCIGPGGLYGIHPLEEAYDIEDFLGRRPTWRQNRWIPIAGDGCGDQYVVPTRGEFGDGFPVLFIDNHKDPDTPAYIVASSVGKFLEFLLRTEIEDTLDEGKDLQSRWPFDEAIVRAVDPDIVRFHGVPFPWELE